MKVKLQDSLSIKHLWESHFAFQPVSGRDSRKKIYIMKHEKSKNDDKR